MDDNYFSTMATAAAAIRVQLTAAIFCTLGNDDTRDAQGTAFGIAGHLSSAP